MLRRTFLMLSALALLPLSAQALAPDTPTVLITGANRGIGLELAKQYAAKGWNVIPTTRRSIDDPGTAELRELVQKYPGRVAIERIDVTDTAMIRAVATKYSNQPIDVLINNAANVEATLAADLQILNTPFEEIDFDKSRVDFDVNTIGPMRMIQAFLPHIEKSRHKKIVNVTSMAGSFGRPMPGWMGMNYGASKAGLNKYSVLLANALQDKKIHVALVQPVFVASKKDMKDDARAAPVEQEIAKLIKVIDDLKLENSGKITNFTTGQFDPY